MSGNDAFLSLVRITRTTTSRQSQASGDGSVNVQVQSASGGSVVAGRDLVVLDGRRMPVETAVDLVEQPAEDKLAWVDDLDTTNPPPAGPGPDAGIFRLLGYLIRLRLWRRSERLRARSAQ